MLELYQYYVEILLGVLYETRRDSIGVESTILVCNGGAHKASLVYALRSHLLRHDPGHPFYAAQHALPGFVKESYLMWGRSNTQHDCSKGSRQLLPDNVRAIFAVQDACS